MQRQLSSLIILTLCLFVLTCSEKTSKPPSTINHPPEIPTAINPANNSQGNQTNITLSWQCSDPDGDRLRYAIYFGDQPNPQLADSGLTQTSLSIGWVEYATSYFWKITAIDEHGDSTSGQIWSFTTRSISGILPLGSVNIPTNPATWFSLAASGNYVYVADPGSPLFIFDLTDPSQPTLISQYGDGDSIISQIMARDDIAYLAEALYGLEIIDISNPASPRRLSGYHEARLVNSLDLKGNYAYLGSSGGIITLDISNPSNPVLVDTSNISVGVMKVEGDYAYSVHGCGEIESSCLDCFEIHDNISFELVNSLSLGGYIAEGFDASYRYLFISFHSESLRIYSLITPSNPQLVYSFPHDSTSGNYAPFASGDLLYTASLTDRVNGIRIFNVADIANPSIAAEITTDIAIQKIIAANNYIYAIGQGLTGPPRLLVFGYLQK